MNRAMEEAIQQAKTIKSREDYDSLPQEVKDWCESILKMVEKTPQLEGL